MTQILNLPLLSFTVAISNNEDWNDSWAYIDANSSPISLAGLVLTMMLRDTANGYEAKIVASSISGLVHGLPQNGFVTSGGDDLNIVGLAIPVESVRGLRPGDYLFEVQATGEGVTRTIASGPVTVSLGVVR